MAINGLDYQDLGEAADALCKAIKERHKMRGELDRETEIKMRNAHDAAMLFASKSLGQRLHSIYTQKNETMRIGEWVQKDISFFVKCYVDTRKDILIQFGINEEEEIDEQ